MIEIAVKNVEPFTVAFLQLRGDYSQIPEGYTTLYTEIGARALVPAGPPMSVYMSDPATTAETEAIYELWAPVDGVVSPSDPDEAGFGVKNVHGGRVVAAVHQGPYDEVGGTYEQLIEWINENDKQIAGPPMELYLNGPDEVPESEYLTEVRIPIA